MDFVEEVDDDSQIVCFFFNDTATTEIYTLSLHDALPISFLPVENALTGPYYEILFRIKDGKRTSVSPYLP